MIKPISNLRGAVVVWLISYIFFLFTLANNFSASHDSIHYVLNIINGDHLFHQHHLLYFYYARNWWLLFKNIFPSAPDHLLIESFTAVWGSANLAVCYLFFRNRFGLTQSLSAIGVALTGFSYGTWFYSVNIEVYAPPIFFILSSLYVITRKNFQPSDVWKVAILHSMAILFHQVNILFAVVIIFWLWSNRNYIGIRRSFIQYALIGLVFVGGLYIFCGVFYENVHSVNEFTSWVLGYTVGHSYWEPLSVKTPVNALTGFSRAFIGGHFIFQHPYLEEAIKNSFRAHGLRDELFLSKDISKLTAWTLTALALIAGSLLVVMAFRFLRSFKKMHLHFHVIRPVLACILVYSLFFLFWMPEILEFWILQMILIWLVLVGMLPVYRSPLSRSPLSTLFLLLVCMFTLNYFGSIKWLNKTDHDLFYVEVQKLDRSLTPLDVVVVEDDWIMKDYVRYFSRAKVFATDEPGYNRNEAIAAISRALVNNHKVYVHRNSLFVPISSY